VEVVEILVLVILEPGVGRVVPPVVSPVNTEIIQVSALLSRTTGRRLHLQEACRKPG
jgi:hypothetical protein